MELCVLMDNEGYVQLALQDSMAQIVHRVTLSFSFCLSSLLILVICPGIKSGFCFNGGICTGGISCLCGLRSEWSGVDCSESKSLINLICPILIMIFCRTMFRRLYMSE
jgi:hypothetical protein